MKFFFFFFILIFPVFAQTKPSLSTRSLYANFYRPGYWSPILLESPSPLQGTPLITIQGENFELKVRLNKKKKVFYLPVEKDYTPTKVSFLGQEVLSSSLPWRKLSISDKLIGVCISPPYNLELIGENINHHWGNLVEMEALPIAEGLFSLNLLILEDSFLNKDSLSSLEKWVNLGGHLIFLGKEELFPHSYSKKLPLPFPIPSATLSQIGESGHLLQISKDSFSELPWKDLVQITLKEKPIPIYPLSSKIFPQIFPQSWDPNIYLTLFILCLCHLVILWLCCSWLARSSQKNNTPYSKKIFFASSITIIFIGATLAYLEKYQACLYGHFSLSQMFPKSSQSICHQYHFFSPLRSLRWENKFSSLPWPLGAQNYSLIEEEKGWLVRQDNFRPGQYSLWYTLSKKEHIGVVEGFLSPKRITFRNALSGDWNGVLWKDKRGFLSLGKVASGKTIKEDLDKNRIHRFAHIALPPLWQKHLSLFQEMEKRLPFSIIQSFYETEVWDKKHNNYANYKRKEIRWLKLEKKSP